MSVADSEFGVLADELNLVLDHANEVIRACGFGIFAKTPLDERTWLAFGKLNGVWCLHVLNDAQPGNLWSDSVLVRVQAATHLPDLVAELRLAQTERVKSLRKTIDAARAFIDSLEQEL